jgi:hypothetical protein
MSWGALSALLTGVSRSVLNCTALLAQATTVTASMANRETLRGFFMMGSPRV